MNKQRCQACSTHGSNSVGRDSAGSRFGMPTTRKITMATCRSRSMAKLRLNHSTTKHLEVQTVRDGQNLAKAMASATDQPSRPGAPEDRMTAPMKSSCGMRSPSSGRQLWHPRLSNDALTSVCHILCTALRCRPPLRLPLSAHAINRTGWRRQSTTQRSCPNVHGPHCPKSVRPTPDRNNMSSLQMLQASSFHGGNLDSF